MSLSCVSVSLCVLSMCRGQVEHAVSEVRQTADTLTALVHTQRHTNNVRAQQVLRTTNAKNGYICICIYIYIFYNIYNIYMCVCDDVCVCDQ
jgi:hypothetical protein